MPVRAVVFDMDGVIVDSESYWWETRVEFAGQFGKVWSFDDQRAVMGSSTHEWTQIMQERLALEMPRDQIAAAVIGGVLARLHAHLPVLPGAVEAARACASAYPLALASGSPTVIIDEVMRLAGLDDVFTLRVYGDDMTHGKPDPEIYLTAAARLGVEPASCLGVEDSGNGLRALKAAGMVAVAVPSPGFPLTDDLLALADVRLPSLTEFSLELVRTIG